MTPETLEDPPSIIVKADQAQRHPLLKEGAPISKYEFQSAVLNYATLRRDLPALFSRNKGSPLVRKIRKDFAGKNTQTDLPDFESGGGI